MKVVKILFSILMVICVLLGVIYNYKIANKKYVHFSIDDTIQIFEDITKNEDKYTSIFDNETLRFLKKCNEMYGTKFSMYCFYEYNGICLENCTEKFVNEFEQNSDWLKFGFHALNGTRDYSELSEEEARTDYQVVTNQLKRIVGTKSITTVIRMEKFISNKQNIQAIKNMEYGITGLLGADTIDRQDYYLDSNANKILFEKDFYYDNSIGMCFYNTDIRLENVKDIEQEMYELKEDKEIIIFTHEWILNEENKNKIKEICELAKINRYSYEFPSNKNWRNK